MTPTPKKKSKPSKGISKNKIPEEITGAGIIELEIAGTIFCMPDSLEFEYFHALLDSNRAFGNVSLSYGFKGKFIVTGITTSNAGSQFITEISLKVIRT